MLTSKQPGSQASRFYERWYRPENMAVVIVGDFASPEDVVTQIKVRAYIQGKKDYVHRRCHERVFFLNWTMTFEQEVFSVIPAASSPPPIRPESVRSWLRAWLSMPYSSFLFYRHFLRIPNQESKSLRITRRPGTASLFFFRLNFQKKKTQYWLNLGKTHVPFNFQLVRHDWLQATTSSAANKRAHAPTAHWGTVSRRLFTSFG